MKKHNVLTISEQIALQILREEFSTEEEKLKQKELSKQISAKKLRSKKREKEDGAPQLTDEADDESEEKSSKKDQETKIEPKPKPQENPKEKSNTEFKVSAPEKIPSSINLQQIVKQINNLRAGKSLNDKNILNQLEDYYEKLGQAEERSLYVFLSSLASILTGGTEGSEAPRPETAKVDVKLKKKSGESGVSLGSDKKDKDAPIIVGEVSDNFAQKIRLLESMSSDDLYKCVDGRVVNFGSPECIIDIGERINDLTQMRDSCGTGSADRASMNGTLKYLRMKLRTAQKLASMKS